MGRRCLAVALLVGLSPGQRLVLCIGPEGTLSFEMASEDASCGGCPEVAEQTRDQGGRSTLGEPAECPCSDFLVVGGDAAARATPRPIDVDIGQLADLPVPLAASIVARHGSAAPRAARIRPGLERALTALSTVVLRV